MEDYKKYKCIYRDLINIWFLGIRTWSNLKTPLSMVLYAPFPNFSPISPIVRPGRGEWSSKLLNCTINPSKKTMINKRDGSILYHSQNDIIFYTFTNHELHGIDSLLWGEHTQYHVSPLYPFHQATTKKLEKLIQLNIIQST